MATSANEVGVSLLLASSTIRIRLLVLGALLAAFGVGPAFGQGATKPLPDDVVVHRGVYRYADQQWIPGEPVAQKTLAVLYDNTNGTGGFQPPSQLPGVDLPATFIDWATCDGGLVKKIDIGYATDESEVKMELSLHTGTTDFVNGPEILSLSLSNLPGSQSGDIEVFMVTVEDFSGEDVFRNAPYLPPGPCGAALRIFEKGTGWLTADGGRGITDFFRILGEQVNRAIDGFFAQFYLRLEGDPVDVWYVDDTHPDGGDGSRANPFNTGNAAQQAADKGDLFFLFEGTYGPFVLEENQKLFGQGRVFGDIPAGDPPVITNPGGTAVEVKGCGVKMSGFDIMDADIGTLIAGFDSPIPESCFVISEEIRANLIGVAFRFGDAATTVEITNADMSQVGVGLSIEGGTVDVNLKGNGRIEGGTAVEVTGGHNGTLNVGAEWTITTQLGLGLDFNGAHGEYTFNGPVTVEDGAGIVISGGSDGTFTFSNTTLEGGSVLIEGGSSKATFGSKSSITQNNDDAVVTVNGDHTGQLDFNGDINATNGTGLQFNEANGVYNFFGPVTLNGGDAGIDILNSLGTFTFFGTDVISPNGIAFNVDGGSANVNYNGGSITQINPPSMVSITNWGHAAIIFNGTNFNDPVHAPDHDASFRVCNIDTCTTALIGTIELGPFPSGFSADRTLFCTNTFREGSGVNWGEIKITEDTYVEGRGVNWGEIKITDAVDSNFNFGSVTTPRVIIENSESSDINFQGLNIDGAGAQTGVYVENPGGSFVVTGDGTPGSGGTIENAHTLISVDDARIVTIQNMILRNWVDNAIGIENVEALALGNVIMELSGGGLSANKIAARRTLSSQNSDAIHVKLDGTTTATVILENNVVTTNQENGITILTTDASSALVTLTNNDVSAATNDFLLSQQDASTFLLAGFEGGDADAVTSFLQATNTGTPSVVVIGSIGTAPASDTADLRLLAKTVSDTHPVAGDTLTYTLRAANAGPAPATEVVLADLLPAGLTYVPGTLTVNGDARTDAPDGDDADFGSTAANTVTVSAATFAVGDTLVLAFQVRVDEAADGTTITNTATITGAEPDALGGNNDASVAIDVGMATAVAEAGEMPDAFVLDQNYPNPFNPITTIRYAVSQPSRVRLSVFDVLGPRVAVLVDEQKAAGRYEVRFDARGLPSGMYVYQMTTEGFTQTRKLILLK